MWLINSFFDGYVSYFVSENAASRAVALRRDCVISGVIILLTFPLTTMQVTLE